MELWLDTIDFNLIEKSIKQLNVTGITTNPSILAQSQLSAQATIRRLLAVQSGRVAVQVTVNDYLSMLTQAQKLAEIDARIIIKIPVTEDGLLTIKALSKLGIETMATAIYDVAQVLLAAMSGATYAAPYLSHIPGDIFQVLSDMLDILTIHEYPLKIIAAAIKSKDQIVSAAMLGAHAITIPPDALRQFIGNLPKTMESIDQFEKAWTASGKSLELV